MLLEQKIFGVIYKITNLVNCKVYIGLTTQGLEKRMRQHLKDSHRENQKSLIGKAIKKHGWENFVVDVVFYGFDQDSLNWAEILLIKEDTSNKPEFGYNLTEGGGGTSGFHMYEATK